jgi:hypothetical protein
LIEALGAGTASGVSGLSFADDVRSYVCGGGLLVLEIGDMVKPQKEQLFFKTAPA